MRFALAYLGLGTASLLFSFMSSASTPVACNKPLPAPLTYDALKATLQSCQTKTIADVLPLLPVEFLQNYTLMYHSRGIQSSTAAAPRAILFGSDASLVIAYNGSPTETNYNELEILQYRSATDSFELDAVTFPEDETATTGPVFSEENPSRCIGCHGGSDVKPNWDGYLLWPGAFGAEDEATFISYRSGDQSSDSADYQTFLATDKSGLRYSPLQIYPHNSLVETPNTNLGDRLNRLNMHRLARKMAQDPKLQPYRYALLAAETCLTNVTVGSFADYAPAAVTAKAPHDLAWYESDTTQSQNNDFLARIALLKTYYPNAPVGTRVIQVGTDIQKGTDPGLDYTEPTAMFRLLIEGLAGEQMLEWSTVFNPTVENFNFNSASFALNGLEIPLVEGLFKNEPDILAMYNTAKWDAIDWSKTYYPDDMSPYYKVSAAKICAVLKQKSVAALTPAAPPPRK